MEEEMNWHLNNPPADWTPFDADEYLCWLIETGQVPPAIHEDAPDWYSEAPSIPQNAA